MAEQETQTKTENKMRIVEISKIVLTVRGVKEELDKGVKLLTKISKKKPAIRASTKRIPGFGVRPGLEIGAMVTLRGDEAIELLKRLLSAIDNELKIKQIADNHFSFGIAEYIEIPGEEYDRDIGMRGFAATIVFSRKGKKVAIKKIKKGSLPKKQIVSKEEIIKFMEDNFGTDII